MKSESVDVTPAATELEAGSFLLFRQLLVRASTSNGVRARMFRGTVWTVAGTAIAQISAMLASIGAARILGASFFGGFGMIRSTVVVIGVLAGTGLGLAATKLVAEHRDADPARAGNLAALLLSTSFVLGTVTMVPCLLFPRWIAEWIFHAPALETGLRLGALLVLLNAVSGVQLGVLSGLEAFRQVAILASVEGPLTLACVIGGALWYGLDGAIAGSVAAPALLYWFKRRAMHAAARKLGIAIRRTESSREWPVIITVVAPALLIGISAQPFEWLARVLVARGRGGYEELGIFTAAYTWGQVVSMATAQITAPAVAVLASVFASNDPLAFRKLLRFVAAAVVTIAIAVVGPVVVLAPWIMRAYGERFAAGTPALVAITVAYGLASLSGLLRSALVATGRLWTQNLHAAIWGAVLIATFVLQPHRGALALALAYLAAYGVVVFTQGASVWNALRAGHATARMSSP